MTAAMLTVPGRRLLLTDLLLLLESGRAESSIESNIRKAAVVTVLSIKEIGARNCYQNRTLSIAAVVRPKPSSFTKG